MEVQMEFLIYFPQNMQIKFYIPCINISKFFW